MKKIFYLLACGLISQSATSEPSWNEKILSFQDAKKFLPSLHVDRKLTLYCRCAFSASTVDLTSCGYVFHRDSRRARRLEWEHVVPAEAFGNSFSEWRTGHPDCVKKGKAYRGRKCARKNPTFQKMEGDLYNLFPEIGELNGLRSNFSMAQLGAPGKKALTFGACKAHIEDRKFMPMDFAKGVVARTYLYMDQAYPGRGIISRKNEKLFEAWDKMFPVEKWECELASKIFLIQGNDNPILRVRCEKLGTIEVPRK